jgi:hypothetical protein
MTPSLVINQIDSDEFELVGEINEFADFTPLRKAPTPLRLNVSKVSRVNSIGLRNFIKFLVDSKFSSYELIDASVEVIDQINLVPSILQAGGKGTVISCWAIFSCQTCGHEESFIVQHEEWDANSPRRRCPKCSKSMDICPKNYLDFTIS